MGKDLFGLDDDLLPKWTKAEQMEEAVCVAGRHTEVMRKDFFGIEIEVRAGESVTIELPTGSSLLCVDRIQFDPNWPLDVLVSLQVGSRFLTRVPVSRFQVKGQGEDIGWSSHIGMTRKMVLANVGRSDVIVRGCIDYTHLTSRP